MMTARKAVTEEPTGPENGDVEVVTESDVVEYVTRDEFDAFRAELVQKVQGL